MSFFQVLWKFCLQIFSYVLYCPKWSFQALEKLVEVNPLRCGQHIRRLSAKSEVQLWNILLNKSAKPQSIERDGDDEVGDDHIF